MAIKISGTEVISDASELSNISSFDATTAKAAYQYMLTRDTLEVGDVARTLDSREVGTSYNPSTTAIWGFAQKGTARFQAEVRSQSGGPAGGMRLYRIRAGETTSVFNGTTSSTTQVNVSSDQSVLPGDYFYAQVTGSAVTQGKNTSYYSGWAQNVRLTLDSDSYYLPTDSESRCRMVAV